MRIFIDPGHGGKDPGAIWKDLYEKDISLLIAKRLDLLFTEAGYDILLSRYRDEFLTLKDRVESANDSKADVFCSIHCNAFKNSEANGCETFYISSEEKGIAQKVQENLAKYTSFRDRGVKSKGFYVLKYTKMPAILVEPGFITNEADRHRLTCQIAKDVITYCIYWGILEGLGEEIKWKEQFLRFAKLLSWKGRQGVETKI